MAVIPGRSITVVRPSACEHKLPAEVGSVIVNVVPTTYNAFPLADSVQTAYGKGPSLATVCGVIQRPLWW